MLWYYCIDDALAAHFGIPALGTIPFWVVLVSGLIPASVLAPLQVSISSKR